VYVVPERERHEGRHDGEQKGEGEDPELEAALLDGLEVGVAKSRRPATRAARRQ